ncbi:putative reverse transcriptase domain-containing protein [Tanacetum coccineum]|uniref:Reverse transcriptase domain-containing protein n=1 Tax=Tanacetum coccineum TaxID=301880 RepID=A0ABQ5HAE9_9ASTR
MCERGRLGYMTHHDAVVNVNPASFMVRFSSRGRDPIAPENAGFAKRKPGNADLGWSNKMAAEAMIATTPIYFMMKRISDKRTKNQAKNDKTEHGMEKRGEAKVKSKPKSKKVKVNPEKSTVKSRSRDQRILNGPTRTHLMGWRFQWVSDKEPEAPVKAPQLSGQASPSPDYMPDYVPGPKYPEYLIPSDNEAPIEDQPLPSDALPTVLSPGYVADSDPEEDPEEDPADRGDKEEESSGDDADDEDEEESSGDNADDEDEEEASKYEDKEEEEEHLALADSTTLHAALIAAVAAALPSSSPPASPLSPWSSPLPHIPSLPLHILSPPLPLPSPPTHTSPTYVEASLGYKAAMIQWRATSPSTHHSSEITSPPILLPSTTHRDDLLEADMPLQKRARFIAPTGRFKVGESSSVAARQAKHTLAHRVDYGFIDTVDSSICTSESRVITAVWAHSESRSQAIEAHRALQRDVDVLQRQRIRDEDRPTSHIQHDHDRFRELVCTTDAGPQDGPADVGHKANKSINGDDSHYSGTSSRRTERAARECTYSDILKCQPLNLKESDEVEKKLDDNSRKPFKRQNVARAYTAGPGEKKVYRGSKPLCPKCNYHHDGQCAPKYTNCKRAGHLARDCRSPTAANNQRSPGENQRVVTCVECGVQGYFKRDFPKLKNNNRGNQDGNGRATARAYAVGNAGKNPNSNVVTGTFLLNNRYASILFDTGDDRSFVSTAFSSLIDIVPTAIDHDYDVELADGNIIRVNTIIRGCTLNFLNHPFNIDLKPVELGSFDVIIGMDWLVKYHAVIVCDEKIVRIPFWNEILFFCGDRSKNEHGSRLNIISCTKTQKYLLKGFHVFLAHVTAKKAEDKSEEKRLEDVPIVRDFPEVFP